MDIVQFNCPHCGAFLEASADVDGETHPCPECEGQVTLQVVTPKQVIGGAAWWGWQASSPLSSTSNQGRGRSPGPSLSPRRRFSVLAMFASMEGLFCFGWFVLLAGAVVWMFYMMTFRTKDFIELWKADQEARDRRNRRWRSLALVVASRAAAQAAPHFRPENNHARRVHHRVLRDRRLHGRRRPRRQPDLQVQEVTYGPSADSSGSH